MAERGERRGEWVWESGAIPTPEWTEQRLGDGVVVHPGVLQLMGEVCDRDGLGGALDVVEIKIKGGCGCAGDEP